MQDAPPHAPRRTDEALPPLTTVRAQPPLRDNARDDCAAEAEDEPEEERKRLAVA